MRPIRPIVGAAAVAALAIIGGVVIATSRNDSDAQASYQAPLPAAPAAPLSVAPTTPPVAAASAATTPAPATRTVYRDRVVYRTAPREVVVKKRSTKKSVAIIGGSTVGGAVVGGLLGGKKGAVIGGVVGGAGGTVYDRKTRKKVVVQ